jgi:hypothetical protein
MGLFNRKPKVHLSEFCRDFYTEVILHPAIEDVEDIEPNSIFFETVRRSVIEVDSSFAEVDLESLTEEIIVLRFEVFGLAWLHELGDKHAAAQSTFTKEYLEEQGRSDIWEAMESYNKAIARSSTLGQTKDTSTGRAYLAFLDSMRMQLFEKWHGQGFDPTCVARAANRISAEEAWKKNLTPGYLMLTLCDRLDYEPNDEAQFRLVATIVGLYNGSREALREVKIKY